MDGKKQDIPNGSSMPTLTYATQVNSPRPALAFQLKFWIGFAYGNGSFLCLRQASLWWGKAPVPSWGGFAFGAPTLFSVPQSFLMPLAILLGLPVLIWLVDWFLLPRLSVMSPPRWRWNRVREAPNTNAWVWYAHLLIEGRGVQRDLAEAERWIRRAAAHGNPHAIAWLQRLETNKHMLAIKNPAIEK